MPKYVIEREIPGCGSWTADELRAVSQKSNSVINTLAPQVQWEHSYVTGDKIFCVYIAENEELVLKHAELSGFPANRINRVANIIDPVTAEKVTEPILN
jgi:hypothetical protein